MPTPIPDFVDRVLREWDFIAFFAYDNFESCGRGAVGLGDGANGIQAMYAPREYFVKKGDQAVLQKVDEYDPVTEFLVHFEVPEGMRTIRIRTPEEGRNPKRIWFFEMLRRLEEEPDKMPDPLPDWFAKALEKLNQINKDKP
ncbi:MAG: hypothetical protein GXY61_11355 [Lentisphaerae bacterium]|nr:hypothetical protein [Lentisphaerota bacterium]